MLACLVALDTNIYPIKKIVWFRAFRNRDGSYQKEICTLQYTLLACGRGTSQIHTGWFNYKESTKKILILKRDKPKEAGLQLRNLRLQAHETSEIK